MMLSYQTLDGFYITVNSMRECVKFCLNQGMDFDLTEKFNQDSIEQHFGIHRASLGSNTNPRLYDFNNFMVKIRTAGSQALAPFRGNTKRRIELAPLDDSPLRKRVKHMKQKANLTACPPFI
ncbi:hypothetical protein DPMN_114043 [Dreissena polymorpha]|uniref:Uncharacterized protein n=1 Tax=Dreissena polymorpha TaxID=45954 RepID=A0A9D4KJ59_DREPO|nr:hypothetical protein DPMN_114043 [Dreissena polymorpha]